MAKYGNGVSLEQALVYDIEEIKEALNGRVRVGEDEKGFIYAPGTPEDCKQAIIDIVDGNNYLLFEISACAKALEKNMKDRGCKIELKETTALQARFYVEHLEKYVKAKGV